MSGENHLSSAEFTAHLPAIRQLDAAGWATPRLAFQLTSCARCRSNEDTMHEVRTAPP
jgi:hypothetical protein